jgi:hypothetical protein
MIKYILGAILALAIIGGAFELRSTDQNWQLIIHKKEALNSVTNGAIRIYKIVTELFLDSDLMNTEPVNVE